MRYQPAHPDVPLDLLRTFVAVTKAGTFAKASASLGIPPALARAQMTKLESVLGKAIFEPASGETRLSEYGSLFSSYAARMVSMNDQLLAEAQSPSVGKKWRIGLPRWVLEKDLVEIGRGCSDEIARERVCLRCDDVEHLVRDLGGGLLDVAVVCNIPNPPGVTVRNWREDVHWVKGSGTKLTQGKPIPLVSWPGSMSDRFIGAALRTAGMDHVVTFTSSDLSARMAAVAAGLGVIGVTLRSIGPGTEIATEDFLPPLPQTKKAICIREGLDAADLEPVVRVLETCLTSMSTNVIAADFGRSPPQWAHELI